MGLSSAGMDPICDDLEAETAALRAIVEPLTEEQWRLPTPAAGWDTHETIIHLGMADYAASLAVLDPDGFNDVKAKMMAGEADLHDMAEQIPSSLLESYHTAAAANILSGQAHQVAALRDSGVMVVSTPPQLLTERLISEYLMLKTHNQL